MADVLLEVEGLTKRYGGLIANRSVSMTIAESEIRGLIGPNGAGKTTLVNLLTGIETPDAGRFRLGGTDLTGLSSHRIAAEGLVRTFQIARVFANARAMAAITDGELYWQITKGARPMPSFESLSEQERWQLVDYVRMFAQRSSR